MLIPTLTIQLYLPWAMSLKDKRQELRSIIDGVSHKFRVVVAESDFQDLHQSAEVTIVSLASDQKKGDSIMDHVVKYIEDHTQAEITSIQREYR